MKPDLWIVSELFPPEETSTAYIMGEVALALSSKYNVHVICGPQIYDTRKAVDIGESVHREFSKDIIHVRGVKENKSSKLSRVRKFLVISYRLFLEVKKQVKEDDMVLMVSNPFPLILLMSRLRRSRRFTLKMLVHDIYPEALYTEMNLPKVVFSFLGRLFNKAYAGTDCLISIGRDMSEVLKRKIEDYKESPVIYLVENWGDIDNIVPRDFSDSSLVIQYAGNIGHSQGVDVFIKDFITAGNTSLRFEIWGTGSMTEQIEEMISSNHIRNVSLKGPYKRSQQSEVLSACDIALVTLVKGMYGLGVPSKSYNILAAGRPILYIGEKDTEIWSMIEENGIGFCFEPDETLLLIDFLKSLSLESKFSLKMKGIKARSLVERKYSKEIILNKFKSII